MLDLTPLIMLMNVANIFDLETTRQGLSRGLKEANPFANYVLKTYGMQGLATIKIGAPLILTTTALLATTEIEKLLYAKMLGAIAVVFSLAAINNIIALTFKRT